MQTFALIVAAGSGSRMNHATPKQFLKLNGQTVLWHSLELFGRTFADIRIALVVQPEFRSLVGEIVASSRCAGRTILIDGGATRFQSVQRGLAAVPDDAVVFVHDAVRCLATPDLLRRCLAVAVQKGNAIPAVVPRDSVRLHAEGTDRVLDRMQVRLIQTPQTFRAKLLKRAYKRDFLEKFTDESTVIEADGIEPVLVEGEETNLKITHPHDLVIAESILRSRATA